MLKFILLFIYVVVIFLANSLASICIIGLINLIIALLFKIKFRKMLNDMIGVCVFSIFVFLVNLFSISLIESIMIAMKLIFCYNIIYIFSKIFTPLQLIEMLEKILSHTRISGQQNGELGILICAVISFIPIFIQEMKLVLYSMRAKCVCLGIKNFYLIIAPMLNSSVKRTNDVELALRLKGYR